MRTLAFCWLRVGKRAGSASSAPRGGLRKIRLRRLTCPMMESAVRLQWSWFASREGIVRPSRVLAAPVVLFQLPATHVVRRIPLLETTSILQQLGHFAEHA
jgi:hypothetical protein